MSINTKARVAIAAAGVALSGGAIVTSVLLHPEDVKADTVFTPANPSCKATKFSQEWRANGDVVLYVGVSCAGVDKGHIPFTLANGRVLDNANRDVGAVPSGFSAALNAYAGKIDAAVAALCGAGKCDP